ncbi:MAG: hypothetical protein M3N26_03830 [Pseudomonadota bacterium]|nr:hypothetical protein [Pseudomonadota bacterium]
MRSLIVCLAMMATLLANAPARADSITITYGAPGVLTPSAIVMHYATTIGTESFDGRTSGSFSTSFNSAGTITGTYSGGTIASADLFGGAGGTGRYIEALANTAGYTITLATSGIPGVNYFGYWLSAVDAGNQLTFKRAGTVVGTYSPSKLAAVLGDCSASNAYCGNPNTAFRGQDRGEAFTFVNFVDLNGFFDEIDVFEKPASGNYESDNHTVGYCANTAACVNGTVVPEPMSAMIVVAGVAGLMFIRFRQGRREMKVR